MKHAYSANDNAVSISIYYPTGRIHKTSFMSNYIQYQLMQALTL